MYYSKCNLGYILKLDSGEEIHAALRYFSKKVNLHAAFYKGIGAIKDVELGYWRPELENYDTRIFRGDYELVSIIGDLGWTEDGAILHSHVTFGDQNFQTFSGHLMQAIVSPQAEIFVSPIDISLTRKEVPGFRYKELVSGGRVPLKIES